MHTYAYAYVSCFVVLRLCTLYLLQLRETQLYNSHSHRNLEDAAWWVIRLCKPLHYCRYESVLRGFRICNVGMHHKDLNENTLISFLALKVIFITTTTLTYVLRMFVWIIKYLSNHSTCHILFIWNALKTNNEPWTPMNWWLIRPIVSIGVTW